MRIDMKSLMGGKAIADQAIKDIQLLADKIDHAKVSFCRAGDDCKGDEKNGYYDNRDILSMMRAEALAAESHLERLRALGGKIQILQTRAGST